MSLYKPFEGTTQEELKLHRPKSPDFLICHVCGLSSSLQEHNGYVSHVKVSMNSSRGMWSLGEKYFLKELPKHPQGEPTRPNSDYAVSKLLSENSNVPVAKDMRGWEDSTSYWRLMERVPGTTLRAAQRDFTLEQHRTIGTEIAEYLAEARKFTSTKPEAPDGQPIRDQDFGASDHAIDLMTTDREEWWARTEPRIRNRSSIPRETIRRFKESYPIKEGAKYVLSHGDLDPSNIMVKDGHVTAIIDWEHGGYRPEWWEWSEWHSGTRESSLNFIRDHPDELTWDWVVTEQMMRLGIDVDIPDDVLAFMRMYNKYVGEPSYKEVPKYEHEEYDRYLYWHCTNYRRYLNDKDLSAGYLAERRKKEVKEEAKRAAIMLTFDKLSPDEQDIFLTGKIQRGSGGERQRPGNLDDDLEQLELD
ncbi:uncharacterized protein EAE98_000984 [Botrytis deweyae]|uniref:Aminoglycoside phosphotransferase domain-containing protein n=1 Tax=Botrytis deweyae TaxID=2478750 RepID=A0ABQ7J069_9HELO|nr:uncharacterized protein EAE98_000984 [Botrytis deweyae]KAF7938646.1 hypothetical protein EAE98_000984 [Botrytis deweyae]